MACDPSAGRDAFLARIKQGPAIMGILNVTPDSFSDGGLFDSVETALAQARRMVAEGADVIDVGGESTRPGAAPVGEDEERARVLPVIEALVKSCPVPISVDTYKASVARDAVAAGASIINDVWGFQKDPEMPAAVAETGAAAIAMYNRPVAEPDRDVIADMRAYLARSLELADGAGVPRERILLDPGVGFGKTWQQSVRVLAEMEALDEFGLPVLVGLSRKSFIGQLLDAPVGERLIGTIAANTVCLMKGAAVIRVHDVAEHREVVTMVRALKGKADG